VNKQVLCFRHFVSFSPSKSTARSGFKARGTFPFDPSGACSRGYRAAPLCLSPTLEDDVSFATAPKAPLAMDDDIFSYSTAQCTSGPPRRMALLFNVPSSSDILDFILSPPTATHTPAPPFEHFFQLLHYAPPKLRVTFLRPSKNVPRST